MDKYTQILECMDCDKLNWTDIESYDNNGTLVEEMSVKEGRAQDAFIAKHQGHNIETSNHKKEN